MRWNTEERRNGVRAIGLCRVVAVPVFLAVCLLQDDAHVAPLVALAAVMLAVTGAGLAMLRGERWQDAPLPLFLVVDAFAVAGAIALSGGGESDARFVAPLVLVGVAVALPRSLSAWNSLGLTAACAVPVLAIHGGHDSGSFFVASAFAALLALTVARDAEDATLALRALAEERRTLMAAALDVESGTRRDVAQDVHDRALQTMLAVRQDLDEAANGDLEMLAEGRRGVDDAIMAIRDAVHELDAGALTGRLRPSLHALMERAAATYGIEAHATVELDAGVHDELLYGVARQLVPDAAQRAGTTTVSVSLRRDGDKVVLEVCDDGGLLARSFGLAVATCAERLAAAGGALEVRRTAAGNAVAARLPDVHA